MGKKINSVGAVHVLVKNDKIKPCPLIIPQFNSFQQPDYHETFVAKLLLKMGNFRRIGGRCKNCTIDLSYSGIWIY